MIGYAMQQEIKAMQEETTKRFDNVMKALVTLTTSTIKTQPENEKYNTSPQYDDLGLLMNTQNLNGSLDPKKKRMEDVVFRERNNDDCGLRFCVWKVQHYHGIVGVRERLRLGITQDGTARDYVVLFERLTYQLVGVPEPVLEGTFISGLKPELRAYVRVMQPEGLHHAMKLSISIDENKTCNNVLWGGGLHRSTIEKTTYKGENFKRLIDSKLQAKRAKGLCYNDRSDEEVAREVQVKRWDPGTKID
ncbi:hypothetical protein Tco_0217788 [Tanacetum coccineum]